MKKRQIWTVWNGLQMKLFDTNEPMDCTYLTLDRGKMEQKRKLAKTTHNGKKKQYKPWKTGKN